MNHFEELTLKVNLSNTQESFPVQIKPNATILSLKETIKHIHPQHPKCDDQRIIYRGKLLEDVQVIDTILGKINSDIQPTLHLVLKPSLPTLKENIASEEKGILPESSNLREPSTTNNIPTAQSMQYNGYHLVSIK
ncbi:unnamed protein product [Rhizopus stolonifer]